MPEHTTIVHNDPPRPTASVPDLTGYRDLHRALLRSADQLVDGVAGCPPDDRSRWRALARWYRGYRGEIAHHHHVEDEIFFPALSRQVPVYSDYAAALDGDHARLDELLERLDVAIAELCGERSTRRERRHALVALTIDLRDHLTEHLTFEDRDVLPLFERHVSVDEYAELEKRALSSAGIRQAWFTVPWYMATVDPQTARTTWADAPIAMKIVHVLSRRSYQRLTARAFEARS